jgi:hypothetical protein
MRNRRFTSRVVATVHFRILIGAFIACAMLAVLPTTLAETISDYELVYRVESPFRSVNAVGKIELTVFPAGIRGDSLFFSGFSKSGEEDLIVMSRLTRMYGRIPVDTVTRVLEERLQPQEKLNAGSYSLSASGDERIIAGLSALHYRVHLGTGSHVDIWITEALEESEQFRRVVNQIIGALAAPIAPMLHALPGMPLEVTLHTRRFPDLELLAVERISLDGSRAPKSLKVGRFYLPAPFQRLFTRR